LLARPVRAPSAEAAAREEIWECSDGSSLLRIALLLLALIADTSGRAHPREKPHFRASAPLRLPVPWLAPARCYPQDARRSQKV